MAKPHFAANKKGRYLVDSALHLDWHMNGVAEGARTLDNRNHNPGLYQLSYSHRNFIL